MEENGVKMIKIRIDKNGLGEPIFKLGIKEEDIHKNR